MKRQDERFHGEDKGMSKHAMTRRLRLGRHSQVGQVYLLTSVVKDRQAVFQDFQLGRRVVNALRYYDEQGWTASLACVAMPDHLHWLVELRQHSLPLLMQQMKSRSAKAVFQDQPTKRTLWQAGYHDRAMRDEQQIMVSACYIVANPLRAGLVQRVGDYPLWDAVWL